MHLIYLHGFNSSPHSHKAQVTRAWMAEHHPEVRFICPVVPPYPEQAGPAITEACLGVNWESALVMGSSMGGFYATWLADRHGCRAVLINPAVRPWQGREYLLGEQTNFHTGETYLFEQRHIDDFAAYGIAAPARPENFWVLLQTGDEVLDYRRAKDFYTGCRLTIEEGGDHGFQGFERFLPDIVRFWKEV